MSNVSFDFQGKVVVVTGAAGGIGAAVAGAFAAAGATLYGLDLAYPEGDPHRLRVDLTDPEAVEVTLRTIGEKEGRIDVLVNNAGGFPSQRKFEDLTPEEWSKSIDVNLTSVFLTTRVALPWLQHSSEGRVINLGSLAGQTAGYTTSPAYAAAKAGVHSLARVLAHELARAGITVNTLAPSAVLTERITQLRNESERAATAATIPLGRYQTPEELAPWVLFLASAEAGYATGQTIAVNGGRLMT